MSSEAQVTCRPFCAVIPLCAKALGDPEDKLRIPSTNISHVRFFIPISPEKAWKFYYPAHREIGSSDDKAHRRCVAWIDGDISQGKNSWDEHRYACLIPNWIVHREELTLEDWS
jgi:hypothetical protein